MTFAERVKTIARASETGNFGGSKVFISHVWDAVAMDPAFAEYTSYGFKLALVAAHRARELELGRADLVEAMEPSDVRNSAVGYMGAVYHFVRID